MIEICKIKNKLAPPVMHSITNRRTVSYNFRNLQEFESEIKITVIYGIRNINYPAPQLWTLLPEEFKQRNTISFFKSNARQWICNECLCRLCKMFLQNPAFL